MNKPTIPEVLDLFIAYKNKPENICWGNLHIVLDDQNVADIFVDFCKNQALEKGDEDGVRLCNILLSMSKTQRLKISREVSKASDSSPTRLTHILKHNK